MSKIAAKGAATGTGVFTLEAPATNTNRTLTLPDAGGTVHTSGSANDHASMPTVNGDPVVESGSNSDGYWVRWADGTAAVRKQSFILTYSSANTLKATWTYPITMTGAVVSNATYLSTSTANPEFFGADAGAGSDQFGGIGVSRPANQSVFAAMLTKGTTPSFVSSDTVRLDVNAIGRWK